MGKLINKNRVYKTSLEKREKGKKYRLEHKKELHDYDVNYKIKNKKKIYEKNADYRKKNKADIKIYDQKYYDENSQKIKNNVNQRYQENKNELWLKTHKLVECPSCKTKTWANFKTISSKRPTDYSTEYTFSYEGICVCCKKSFSFTERESWHDGNMRNDVGYVPKWLTED